VKKKFTGGKNRHGGKHNVGESPEDQSDNESTSRGPKVDPGNPRLQRQGDSTSERQEKRQLPGAVWADSTNTDDGPREFGLGTNKEHGVGRPGGVSAQASQAKDDGKKGRIQAAGRMGGERGGRNETNFCAERGNNNGPRN